jgi:transglutaminase-like putative cysteine protease
VEAGALDWIVTAGRATGIRAGTSTLGLDEATGDLAVPEGGPAPTDYTADSVVSDVDPATVLAADPAPVPAGQRPDLPPALAAFVDRAVRGQPAGADRLLALRAAFTGGQFRHDQAVQAPGGHGYFHLQRLLTDRRGTSEQYAGAFAVMARHLGYDARVVMGLRPRYEPDGRFTATGRDIDAWVEVNFAGLGWLPIDPTPRDHPIGTRPDAPPPAPGDNPGDALAGADQTPAAPDPGQSDMDGLASAAADTGASPLGPVLVAAGAILLLLLAVTPVARAVQRSRRRRAPGRAGTAAAWRDSIDRLRVRGVPVGGAATTGDVVHLVATHPLPPAVVGRFRTLGDLSDQAAYAPGDPPDQLRTTAWRLADDIARDLRAGTRLKYWLDPRPLIAGRM